MFTPRDGTTLREAATRTIALLKETVTHPDRSIAIVMLEAQHLQYAQSIMLDAYLDSLRQEGSFSSGNRVRRERLAVRSYSGASDSLCSLSRSMSMFGIVWRQFKDVPWFGIASQTAVSRNRGDRQSNQN